MEGDHITPESTALAVPAEQPLVGVLLDEDGRQVVQYFAGEQPLRTVMDTDERLRAALAVVGAWSDLDWDGFSAELDRLRHESPPTPPIEA